MNYEEVQFQNDQMGDVLLQTQRLWLQRDIDVLMCDDVLFL